MQFGGFQYEVLPERCGVLLERSKRFEGESEGWPFEFRFEYEFVRSR